MAKQIIILILGSQWESSVQIFKIFCIYSLIDSIGITTYWIYKATGNTNKMFRWGIYQSIIIITAILVGLKWGITGVALSYTIVFIVLLWIPGWHYCFKIINLKVTTLLKVLLPSFICTLITGVSALFLYKIYLHQFTLINQIIIMLLIWIVIYFLCALLIMKKEIIFLKSRFINYN
jgi:PST family polysaccharide transporter